MGVLQRFERRLETIVEGTFARAFKGRVEPVEIAAAMEREAADHAAIMAEGRTIVPNEYVVELGREDFARIGPYSDPLGRELGQMMLEHASEHHWTFLGPVRVSFSEAAGLDLGVFRLRSDVSTPPGTPAPPPVPAATPTPAPTPQPTPARATHGRFPNVFTGNPRLVLTVGGHALSGTIEADGGEQAFVLVKHATTVGRGQDADLRLLDPGVSREHIRVEVGDGEAYVTDLGSTNGTTLDGRPIAGPVRIASGQRLTLGSTSLVFVRDPY